MQKINTDLLDEVMAELDEVFGDKVWQILLVPLVTSIMTGHFCPRYLRRNRKPNDLLWLWVIWQRARRGEEGYEIVFGKPERGQVRSKTGKLAEEDFARAYRERNEQPELIIEIKVPK